MCRQKITFWTLLDQTHTGPPIYGNTGHMPPFWAYSRTLPQGVELLV